MPDVTTQPWTLNRPWNPTQGQHHTHCPNIGSYRYLCRTGNSPTYDFTYSHVGFGKVVWHKGNRDG